MRAMARIAGVLTLVLGVAGPAQAAGPSHVCTILQDAAGDQTTFPSSAGVPGPYHDPGIDWLDVGMGFSQQTLTVRFGLGDVDALRPPGTAWRLIWVDWVLGDGRHSVIWDQSQLGSFFSHIRAPMDQEEGGEGWAVEGRIDPAADTVEIEVPAEQLGDVRHGDVLADVTGEARLFPGADAPAIGPIIIGAQVEQDTVHEEPDGGRYALGDNCR